MSEVSRLVDSWLGQESSGSSDDEQEERILPRPARLGLGAKFLPHEAAAKAQEQKLKKRILGLQKGKPRRDVDIDEAVDPSSSDEEEEGGDSRIEAMSRLEPSRIEKSRNFSQLDFLATIKQYAATNQSAVAKKKKKKRRKRKEVSISDTAAEAHVDRDSKPRKSAKGSGAVLPPAVSSASPSPVSEAKKAKEAGGSSTDGRNKKSSPPDKGQAGQAAQHSRQDVPREKRKRKKTRSKQKNIRKDNRPVEQRPSYRIALPRPADGQNRPNNWLFANLKVDPRVAGSKGGKKKRQKAT